MKKPTPRKQAGSTKKQLELMNRQELKLQAWEREAEALRRSTGHSFVRASDGGFVAVGHPHVRFPPSRKKN